MLARGFHRLLPHRSGQAVLAEISSQVSSTTSAARIGRMPLRMGGGNLCRLPLRRQHSQGKWRFGA